MTTPLVSIYLPTRNRSALLIEAAQSVLAQTFSNFELIIVDDASDDDTPKITKQLASSDPRIRVIRNSMIAGPCDTRNIAIEAARGEFLTGVDDDDLMLPDRLESLLGAHSPRFSLICSSFFVERGGARHLLHRRAAEISLTDILHYNHVGNQALTRRADVVAIGAFDKALPASEDYDLWTRLIDRLGPARRVAIPCYVKREIPNSGQLTLDPRFVEGAIRYTEKHRDKMTSAHLRSQRLIHVISGRARIDLHRIIDVISWQTLPLMIRYIGSQLVHR